MSNTLVAEHDSNVESFSENPWACPVCFENGKKSGIVTPHCGHNICLCCYSELRERSTSPACPLCRAHYRYRSGPTADERSQFELRARNLTNPLHIARDALRRYQARVTSEQQQIERYEQRWTDFMREATAIGLEAEVTAVRNTILASPVNRPPRVENLINPQPGIRWTNPTPAPAPVPAPAPPSEPTPSSPPQINRIQLAVPAPKKCPGCNQYRHGVRPRMGDYPVSSTTQEIRRRQLIRCPHCAQAANGDET